MMDPTSMTALVQYIATKTSYDIVKSNVLSAMREPLEQDILTAVNSLAKEPFQTAKAELEDARGASTEERRMEHTENARKSFVKASYIEQDMDMALKARFYVAACFDAMSEPRQAERWYGKVIDFVTSQHQEYLDKSDELSGKIYSSEVIVGAPIEKAWDITKDIITTKSDGPDILGIDALWNLTIAGVWAGVSLPLSAAYGAGKALYKKPKLMEDQRAYDEHRNHKWESLTKTYEAVDPLIPIFKARSCGYNETGIIALQHLTLFYLDARQFQILNDGYSLDVPKALKKVKENTEPFTNSAAQQGLAGPESGMK